MQAGLSRRREVDRTTNVRSSNARRLYSTKHSAQHYTRTQEDDTGSENNGWTMISGADEEEGDGGESSAWLDL